MDAIKPKVKVIGLDPGQEAISKGEMELGFFNISEVRPYVKYVGPVPARRCRNTRLTRRP